jgi:hypothetical protein
MCLGQTAAQSLWLGRYNSCTPLARNGVAAQGEVLFELVTRQVDTQEVVGSPTCTHRAANVVSGIGVSGSTVHASGLIGPESVASTHISSVVAKSRAEQGASFLSCSE